MMDVSVTPVLAVDGLHVAYGNVAALHGISLKSMRAKR